MKSSTNIRASRQLLVPSSPSDTAIIMYHYVRPLEGSRFPRIYGRAVDEFAHQLDWLSEHFEFCSLSQALDDSVERDGASRPRAILTFDDGLRDHIDYVLPILVERGIVGCFFPPAKPILSRQMLTVHRIHFLLAVAETPEIVWSRLVELLSDIGIVEINLDSLSSTHRFGEVIEIAIKKVLQRVVPKPTRDEISYQLFHEFVGVEEEEFANELYMSVDEVKLLQTEGMDVGSHSRDHEWFSDYSRDEQGEDLEASLSFLETCGVQTADGWLLAYPYGDYNADTLALASEMGCVAALTTRPGYANLSGAQRLTLERFDTNDFPH